LACELEAMRVGDGATGRYWKIINPNEHGRNADRL
jgi:Cu2+-containing amine oxidase